MHEPEETLRAYVRAFESLDPEAVAAFYHLPSLFLSQQGALVVSDAAGARAMAARLLEQARGQEYVRTGIVGLGVRRLSQGLASLSGVFVRFDARDNEVARFGFVYTLLRSGGAWKFATAVAHDASAA